MGGCYWNSFLLWRGTTHTFCLSIEDQGGEPHASHSPGDTRSPDCCLHGGGEHLVVLKTAWAGRPAEPSCPRGRQRREAAKQDCSFPCIPVGRQESTATPTFSSCLGLPSAQPRNGGSGLKALRKDEEFGLGCSTGYVRGGCDTKRCARSYCTFLTVHRELSRLPSRRTCSLCVPPVMHCRVFYCSCTKWK